MWCWFFAHEFLLPKTPTCPGPSRSILNATCFSPEMSLSVICYCIKRLLLSALLIWNCHCSMYFFSPQGNCNCCEALHYEWFITVTSSLRERCVEHKGNFIDICWMSEWMSNEWINERMNATADVLADYGQIRLEGDGTEHLQRHWRSRFPLGYQNRRLWKTSCSLGVWTGWSWWVLSFKKLMHLCVHSASFI